MTNNRILSSLWHSLQNTTWSLHRTLHSTNKSEPSGTCEGLARFTSRTPSTNTAKHESLPPASGEMLYTEEGTFQMSANLPGSPSFHFSRKYIWRLRDGNAQTPEISIWFAKPGTEEVDYLFHVLLVQNESQRESEGGEKTLVEVSCDGGHLCIEDYYNSKYTFYASTLGTDAEMRVITKSWTMHHDVRGPSKDQSIDTLFEKVVDESGQA